MAACGAAQVLRAELRRPSWQREPVHIGTIVDPYQPLEGRYRIIRVMLRELAAARTPATVITKNSMVRRDIDVLRELRDRAGCTVFVSVTTLDAGLLRRMEPGTPPPLRRLETVQQLVRAGIPAGVMAMPLLPGITDSTESLAALAAAARAHDACFFVGGALRLGPGIEPHFTPFLRTERPDLLPLYRRLYPRGYAPRAYVGGGAARARRYPALSIRRAIYPAAPAARTRARAAHPRLVAMPPSHTQIALTRLRPHESPYIALQPRSHAAAASLYLSPRCTLPYERSRTGGMIEI